MNKFLRSYTIYEKKRKENNNKTTTTNKNRKNLQIFKINFRSGRNVEKQGLVFSYFKKPLGSLLLQHGMHKRFAKTIPHAILNVIVSSATETGV